MFPWYAYVLYGLEILISCIAAVIGLTQGDIRFTAVVLLYGAFCFWKLRSFISKHRAVSGGTHLNDAEFYKPGGPFDSILLSTRCLSCGQTVEHPWRWFSDRVYQCSCGGNFDQAPLTEWVRRRVLGDTTLPAGITIKEGSTVDLSLQHDDTKDTAVN